MKNNHTYFDLTPQSVEEAIKNNVPQNSKLIVAISGGQDSLVLFTELCLMEQNLNIFLLPVHFNHKLREESDLEEQYVSSYCKKFNKHCIVGYPKAPLKLDNLENYARKERYLFLKKILIKEKADYILTAHTASDLAETFLIRLFQKKIPIGLFTKRSDKIIRPLFSVFSSAINKYAQKKDIISILDRSNYNLNQLRAKTRHIIIPYLKENLTPSLEYYLAYIANYLNEYLLSSDFFVENFLKYNKQLSPTKENIKEIKKVMQDKEIPLNAKFIIAKFILKKLIGKNYIFPVNKIYEFIDVILANSLAMQLHGGITIKRIKNKGLSIELNK